MDSSVLAAITDALSLLLAGGAGGLLRAIFLKVPRWDGILSVVVGGILGYYVSPYSIPLLGLLLAGFTTEIPNVQRLGAFVLGVLGIGFVGFLIDVWRFRSKQLEEPPK